MTNEFDFLSWALEGSTRLAQIVTTGREQGVPTPVNAAVLVIVHEIEGGMLGMEWTNLEEIAHRSEVGLRS